MTLHITDKGQRIVTFRSAWSKRGVWRARAEIGTETGDTSTRRYGYGPTEEEAIRDYLEQIEEIGT